MNKLIVLILIVCCHSTFAKTTYFYGANIIDGTGGETIQNGSILVVDNKITCVGSSLDCQKPVNAIEINATNKFITPGLVDAHVHFNQTGWFDGRPDGISSPKIYPYAQTAKELKANPQRWFQSYLCSGITAVFDVGGPYWTTNLGVDAKSNSQITHVKSAGPLITWAAREALQLDDEIFTFLPMGSIEESVDSVNKLKKNGSQAVKVWFLAPPKENQDEMDQRMFAIGKAVDDAGLPLLVHATSLREAKIAIKAGVDVLVHSVVDQVVDDEFLTLLVENKVIYVPTLMIFRGWIRALASVALDKKAPYDDVKGCVDQQTIDEIENPQNLRNDKREWLTSDWAYKELERTGLDLAIMNTNLMSVYNAGGLIATGTDAGNPLTLHGPSIYAEMEAMQNAGIPTKHIISMSTKNGARAMGSSALLGTLEAGKMADLLILTDDPEKNISAFRSLTHIMRAGTLHKQEDLIYRKGNK